MPSFCRCFGEFIKPKHPIWMLGRSGCPWQLGSPGVPPLCRKSLFTLLRVCLALTWCKGQAKPKSKDGTETNIWPQLIETLPSKHFLLDNSIISYIYTGRWFYLLTIKKILVNGKDDIPYIMEKTCSKRPTSIVHRSHEATNRTGLAVPCLTWRSYVPQQTHEHSQHPGTPPHAGARTTTGRDVSAFRCPG